MMVLEPGNKNQLAQAQTKRKFIEKIPGYVIAPQGRIQQPSLRKRDIFFFSISYYFLRIDSQM